MKHRAALKLAGYSFVILFLELSLIRYVSGYVRVFGFYLNFVLIATFLGMGVGLLRAKQADAIKWLLIPLTLALLIAVKVFANVVVEAPPGSTEFIWGVYLDVPDTVRRVGVLPVVLLLFTLCTGVFIPLGALLGREFAKFPPLTAYSIDIAGSVTGILAFALMSNLNSVPWVWFAVGFGVLVAVSLDEIRFATGSAIVGVAAMALAMSTAGPSPEYWSPYYRINVFRLENRYSINVNGSAHQSAVDLDPTRALTDPIVMGIRADFRNPFQYITRRDTVLVVGAGTGNDLAILLELGVAYIDAVEIDPVILEIGRAAHFQQPYSDPRVHAHVTDARAFLRTTEQQYDVIVFGTLDSQTLLSGMSSLRLDNYVYTREAFEDSKARLKPGGVVITHHMSAHHYISSKIFGLLDDVWGHPPGVQTYSPYRLFNHTFIISDSIQAIPDLLPASVLEPAALPTDDWPYLYLARRTIPWHYVGALLGVLGVAVVLVFWGGGLKRNAGFDAPMFFMGAGFLLLETKSVTEMSLLFGSTWTVNVLVFTSILVFILIANSLVATDRAPGTNTLFGLLFGALVVSYLIPARSLLPFGITGQWILGSVLVALPIMFAAGIFARMFATRVATTQALAFNLLGAIVGGVLEYSSMVIGVKGLYLVAGVCYAGAALSHRRQAATKLPEKSLHPA